MEWSRGSDDYRPVRAPCRSATAKKKCSAPISLVNRFPQLVIVWPVVFKVDSRIYRGEEVIDDNPDPLLIQAVEETHHISAQVGTFSREMNIQHTREIFSTAVNEWGWSRAGLSQPATRIELASLEAPHDGSIKFSQARE